MDAEYHVLPAGMLCLLPHPGSGDALSWFYWHANAFLGMQPVLDTCSTPAMFGSQPRLWSLALAVGLI